MQELVRTILDYTYMIIGIIFLISLIWGCFGFFTYKGGGDDRYNGAGTLDH